MKKQAVYLASTLSALQLEILKSVALGQTTRQIANQSIYSYDSMKTFRKELYQIIMCHSEQEAMIFAMEADIITYQDWIQIMSARYGSIIVP